MSDPQPPGPPPPLPPGAVPGTGPYTPGLGPPPEYAPPSSPSRASTGMALLALVLSLLGCLVFPVVYVAVGLEFRGSRWDLAMAITVGLGALVVVTSFGLAVAALLQARGRQVGSKGVAMAALVLAGLSPFTGAVGLFLSFILGAGGAHGRPLRRRDGEPALSELVHDGAWNGDVPLPRVDHLSPADRRALGDRWLAAARAEHASVPAFARLSLDLVALGAPPELVARAHRAALEEIGHAQAAFALAGAYLGAAMSAGALPDAATPWAGAAETADERAVRVAVECAVDGCDGEGAAARAARLGAVLEADPAVRAVLDRVAREEEGHAALASDVIGWLLEGPHGPSVRRALAARRSGG